MRIDALEAYNVAEDILAVWRETVGPTLLPVQERAVKEFGLFGESNLIVFSPTSSGKTFIGEMAAVKAARENTMVFYLVPQKALADEKFREFRQRYQRLGIDVVVSSRDHREYDDQIEGRAFQIAIVVFEKLQCLLVSQPQLLQAVGLVVIDELQLLTDESRGPSLELLLTKLKIAPSRPRIIGLSAVLGRAHTLAEWLGAKLLIDTHRPVELRKGVLSRGVFRYREHNSNAEGSEPYDDSELEKKEELLLNAAEQIIRRGEQVLVFVPDRLSSVSYARVLANWVRLPAAAEALDDLREQEETHARDALFEVLSSSVAFHNADLSPEERSIVERHFRSGKIRALFSTTTLAMGMNLPVKNVVMDGRCWRYLKQYRRWSLEQISKSEYENMSGRAGRLAYTKDFGRSFLVARSHFQAEALLRHYVEAEFENIGGTLKGAPLENHVLNLLASGLAGSRSELTELLLSSFTGHVYWIQKMSREEFAASLDKAVSACLAAGLAIEDEQGVLTATRLGHACASKGLDVETAAQLCGWARESLDAVPSDLEVLTVASLTPAGEAIYVNMGGREANDYTAELLKRAVAVGASTRPVFKAFAEARWAIEYEPARGIKKALFLTDWVSEIRTKDIEKAYHVWAGTLRRVAEEYSWLVDGLGAVCEAAGWPSERVRQLVALADRLPPGVREDAAGLARLRAPGLGRVLLRRLADAGLRTREQVVEVDVARLTTILNHRGMAAALWQALHPESRGSRLGAVKASPTSAARAAEPTGEYPAVGSDEPELVVDVVRRRAFLWGREIPTRPPHNLQPQLFLALAVLGNHAGEAVTMADLAGKMKALGALTRKPVTPEPRDLRYRILRVLKRAFHEEPFVGRLEQLLETLPNVGLRLNCRAEVTVRRRAA